MQGESAYDRFFFESLPNPERHINRLYVMSLLFGGKPTPIDGARVLEIGCSTGSHLIPQAERYPGSYFVGIDLSASQISAGIKIVTDLGLSNISLSAQDIREWNESSGTFDYVICHGMFSWVDEDLRRILLEKISHSLAPDGVAYVSFNSSSTWRHRQSLQKIFQQADDRGMAPERRIQRIRSFVALLSDCMPSCADVNRSRVHDELSRLENVSDQLLLHEYLVEGRSFLVSEISNLAATVGMTYLADARPRRSFYRYQRSLKPSALRAVFSRQSNSENEDLFDTIEQKPFRGGLFVKTSTPLSPSFERDRLGALYMSSPLVPVSSDGEKELFLSGNEEPVEVAEKAVAEFLRKLYQAWPSALPFTEMLDDSNNPAVIDALTDLFWLQHIDLSFDNYGCAREAPARPSVLPSARYHAGSGGTVLSRRHEFVRMNDFERIVATLLDGTRTVDDIVGIAEEAIARGEIQVTGTVEKSLIKEAVEQSVREFVERGLIS